MYIVVETICENCGLVNGHLTAGCDRARGVFAVDLFGWLGTLRWLASVLA